MTLIFKLFNLEIFKFLPKVNFNLAPTCNHGFTSVLILANILQHQESGLTSPRVTSGTLSTEIVQEKSLMGKNLGISQLPFTYSQVGALIYM